MVGWHEFIYFSAQTLYSGTIFESVRCNVRMTGCVPAQKPFVQAQQISDWCNENTLWVLKSCCFQTKFHEKLHKCWVILFFHEPNIYHKTFQNEEKSTRFLSDDPNSKRLKKRFEVICSAEKISRFLFTMFSRISTTF